MENIGQAPRNRDARRCALFGHFVARTPRDHARMIAIAPHEGAHVAFRPLVEQRRVTVRFLGNRPGIGELVQHQDAHFVAQIQQFGRGRIVRSAQRVHAHGLQNLQLTLRRAPVPRRAQRAQIVVHANALQLHGLAVEQKTFVGLPTNIAHAKRRVITVENFIAAHDLRDEGITIAVVQIPAARLGNR